MPAAVSQWQPLSPLCPRRYRFLLSRKIEFGISLTLMGGVFFVCVCVWLFLVVVSLKNVRKRWEVLQVEKYCRHTHTHAVHQL